MPHEKPEGIGDRYTRLNCTTGKLEAFGFEGGECVEATRAIEQRLGASGERTRKDDGDESAGQYVDHRA